MFERVHERARGVFLDVMDWLRALGLVVLSLLMVAVFILGIIKMSKATFTLARNVVNASQDVTVMGVTQYLKGLELFFLAPLGLLAFKALGRYVRVQIQDQRRSAQLTKEEREASERDVHQLKVQVGGLVAAFLLTDLVNVVIDRSVRFEREVLLAELAVMAMAIIYVWTLPRTGRND